MFRRHRLSLPRRLGQPKGADDLRLLGFILFVDDAQPAFLAQLDDAGGQILIADTAPELAVERVDRPPAARG